MEKTRTLLSASRQPVIAHVKRDSHVTALSEHQSVTSFNPLTRGEKPASDCGHGSFLILNSSASA